MRTVLVVALFLLLAVAGAVEAKQFYRLRQKIPSPPKPVEVVPPKVLNPRPAAHPESTADASTLALWAKVRGELEARNYSRPTKSQLVELGYPTSPMDGVYGVDVSSWVGQSTFSCMLSSGYNFLIAREYEEICQVDGNGANTVANAWSAGFAHCDVYLFPSYGCGTSAAAQVDATIDAMGSVPFGTLWFDIETGGNLGPDADHAWLQAAIQQAVARIGGDRIGIYASAYEWGQVMGGYADVYSFDLWYPDYDGVPNFDSFSPFAGWSAPSMKQFAGDSSLCGADVDLNWYP